MSKHILTTPVKYEDIASLRIGDIVYLSGQLVTCRDVAHRRLTEQGRPLPVDVKDGVIFHAGPIVRKTDDNKYEMISIGPTTSMRMEKFQSQFIKQTGVRLIIGKGGMGMETAAACRKHKALHLIFPAGCAVLAATCVEQIIRAEWRNLGMPETLWVCQVKELGPLIVSIDSEGNNFIENNKAIFNERKKAVYDKIASQVKFIK